MISFLLKNNFHKMIKMLKMIKTIKMIKIIKTSIMMTKTLCFQMILNKKKPTFLKT